MPGRDIGIAITNQDTGAVMQVLKTSVHANSGSVLEHGVAEEISEMWKTLTNGREGIAPTSPIGSWRISDGAAQPQSAEACWQMHLPRDLCIDARQGHVEHPGTSFTHQLVSGIAVLLAQRWGHGTHDVISPG